MLQRGFFLSDYPEEERYVNFTDVVNLPDYKLNATFLIANDPAQANSNYKPKGAAKEEKYQKEVKAERVAT